MSEYFAIFQIGPVQEFIKTARKTIDYWSGSFLLSYLTAIAISSLDDNNVVFPAVEDNPLYKEVKTQGCRIPWDNNRKIADNVYFPTLPNRVFCIFDDNPQKKLEDAKKSVLKQWEKIAFSIENKFPGTLKKSGTWGEIWKRQIQNPFEIIYVWRKKLDKETYGNAYKKTESLMGKRKASRWFVAGLPEPGHKCSLCGIREALHLAANSPTRKTLREEWNKKVRTGALKFKFRDGETLCAVCMIKRLAPEYAFGNKKGVPSTSTVAVGKTVWDIVDKTGTNSSMDSSKIREFTKKTRDLAKSARLPSNSRLLPKIEKAAEAKNINASLNIDGDWFFADFYESMAKKYPYAGFLSGKQLLMTNVLGPLKKVIGNEKYQDPCKYYAVIVADGDGMGEKLGNITSKEDHKELSQYIAKFSTSGPSKIFEEDHLGFVIYFGGDEGVAFVTLDDLFSAMKALREKWEEDVMKPLQKMKISPPTLSVGVAIAHHQEGLRGVIERAFSAIEMAKEVRTRTPPGVPNKTKDAFAVSLSRRSSGKTISRAQWLMPDKLSVLDCLEKLKELYRGEKLSWAWVEKLYREKKAVGDPPGDFIGNQRQDWLSSAPDLCKGEIERLVKRHKKELISASELNDTVKGLCNLHDGFKELATSDDNFGHQRFQCFINLMDLARYVAKGGGR